MRRAQTTRGICCSKHIRYAQNKSFYLRFLFALLLISLLRHRFERTKKKNVVLKEFGSC